MHNISCLSAAPEVWFRCEKEIPTRRFQNTNQRSQAVSMTPRCLDAVSRASGVANIGPPLAGDVFAAMWCENTDQPPTGNDEAVLFVTTLAL